MNFQKIALFLVLLISISCFSGCVDNSGEVSEPVTIKMAGGTALIPIIEDISKEYMLKNNNVQIEVTGGGSGFGVKETGEGHLTIGMAGRNLKSEEKELYNDITVYKIGLDGIAIITSNENNISDLTTQQVQKIYSGEITNWKSVGGSDHTINVYTREEDSGTRDTFWKEGLLKSNISKKALMVASNGEMKSKVSSDENGIGYVSIGYVDESINTVQFNGVEPTQENVKEGIYTIYRPLNLLTKGEPDENVKKFIEYVLSEKGQEIVKNDGFLPVN
ncbi:phosphate transport system substrate-binding protein [Methanococcus maripaludis]|uniref:Phosphate transport system substrate-binding protein n=1 Tax=Methanococcus maripaludis TaxID=39152 RepID=A0A7J9P6N0_METMI|nr:phosphate ABC transporter substrate-binding protein [Methanococcus maripaludis]MBA2858852.1 phosphate transport system substrate-binding protein [Methanococcus maripaludis]